MTHNDHSITSYENLFQELLELNSQETLGKQYFNSYHNYLSYTQFLYLSAHSSENTPARSLISYKAMAEQQKLQEEFHHKYHEFGLTEQDFFHEDHNIEIERLYRYISIPRHKHIFVECSCVLRGSCKHIVNGCEYIQHEGDFTVLTPGVEHEQIPDTDCVCLTIKIRTSLFNKLRIPNLPIFVCPVNFLCGNDHFVFYILLSIYEQQKNNQVYSDQLVTDMFQVLMTYIMQNYRDTMQLLIAETVQDAKITPILNYMYENYQTITLRSLAKYFHFNESYLSNMIHKQFNKPFSKILKEFKLLQAAELLKTTDMKLSNICDAVGYKDTRQFMRNYKEQYGITPAKDRKMPKT